jgi:hypothetical protein
VTELRTLYVHEPVQAKQAQPTAEDIAEGFKETSVLSRSKELAHEKAHDGRRRSSSSRHGHPPKALLSIPGSTPSRDNLSVEMILQGGRRHSTLSTFRPLAKFSFWRHLLIFGKLGA